MKLFFKHSFSKKQLLFSLLFTLTGIALACIYSTCIDPAIVGLIYDDGIYLSSARSIAEGGGYKLPYMVGTPNQLHLPALYPLVLSLGWLISPSFPENIPLFAGLSIFCSLTSLGLFYVYLRRCKNTPRWLSVVLLFFIASNFFYLYFSTSIMSEIFYLPFSIAVLFLAEKAPPPFSTKRLIGLILLSALAFHARMLGIALIGAIVLGLILRKQWKQALIYGGGSTIFSLLPWMAWVSLNKPPEINDLNYPLVYEYGSYAGIFIEDLFTRKAFLLSLIQDGFLPFLYSLKLYLFPVGNLWIALVPLLLLTRYLVPLGWNHLRKAPASFSFLYLLIYSGFIILWRYDDQVYRFIVDILPWLWYYALIPLASFQWKQAPQWKTSLLALFLVAEVIFSFISYGNLRELRANHFSEVDRSLWSEYQTTFHYIRQNLPEKAVIGTAWGPMVHLYTGRLTYTVSYWSLKKIDGKYPVHNPKSIATLNNSMRHYGVNYLMVEPKLKGHQVLAAENPVAGELVRQFPEHFTRIYASSENRIQLYQYRP